MVADPDATAARVRAYLLMEAAQDEAGEATLAELSDLEDEAGRCGWPEVAFLAAAGQLLARVVRPHEEDLDPQATELVARGEALGASGLLGLALALRAVVAAGRGRGEQVLTDAGRAVALQDDTTTPALDRCTALVVSAAAYNTMRLWELVDELYDRASALAPQCPVPVQEPAIVVDRVLVLLEWASGLIEVGEDEQAAELLGRAAEAAELAVTADRLPGLWQRGIRALRDLLVFVRDDGTAFAAADGAGPRAVMERHRTDLVAAGDVEAVPLLDAFVALSLLRSGRRDEALSWVSRSIVLSASSGATSFHAWVRAQVLMPVEPDEATTALQEYGARVGRLRWTSRRGVLDAARARIEAARLGAENAALARDVRLDPLTGLSNRRVFDAWLTDEHVTEPAVALVLVDLDDFKDINDEHGHAVGDEVLRRVGRVLAGHVRAGDLALRLGGDEFAVVLQADPAEEVLDALEAVAATRAAEVVEAVTATDWERVVPGLSVRISVGFAVARLAPGDPKGADRLYRAADGNLYEAKAHRARRRPLSA